MLDSVGRRVSRRQQREEFVGIGPIVSWVTSRRRRYTEKCDGGEAKGDTRIAPSKRTSRFTPAQQQLRGDGEEMPFAGHAFERVIASVVEFQS